MGLIGKYRKLRKLKKLARRAGRHEDLVAKAVSKRSSRIDEEDVRKVLRLVSKHTDDRNKR